jgi:hypothetical protein
MMRTRIDMREGRKFMNKIYIDKQGQLTVIGPIAHKLYYNKKLMDEYVEAALKNTHTNKIWVVDENLITRAAQSCLEFALKYYSENRILVIKDF